MAKRRKVKCAIKKIPIKKHFALAMKKLRKLNASGQRAAVVGSSNAFIKDVTRFFKNIRKKPALVKAAHRKVLRKHSKSLRKLIHAKTPVHEKRLILVQKGGIFPALVPIIIALIGAGGTVAGAATTAAIMKA